MHLSQHTALALVAAFTLGACVEPTPETVGRTDQAIKFCPQLDDCEPPPPPDEDPPPPPPPEPEPILRAVVHNSTTVCGSRTVFFTVRNIGDAASEQTTATITNNGLAPVEFIIPPLEPLASSPVYARTLDPAHGQSGFSYAISATGGTLIRSCP
jgi:hypothetical protein